MSDPKNPDDDSGLFGPMIFSYTRKQAIEDGVLIDLTEIAPAIQAEHYKYPVALTAAAWAIVQRALENDKVVNDIDGIIHDVLWMSRAAGREVDPSTRLFQVIIAGSGPIDLHTFKIVCGPGDNAEPVLTIMLPDED